MADAWFQRTGELLLVAVLVALALRWLPRWMAAVAVAAAVAASIAVRWEGLRVVDYAFGVLGPLSAASLVLLAHALWRNLVRPPHGEDPLGFRPLAAMVTA